MKLVKLADWLKRDKIKRSDFATSTGLLKGAIS